MINKSLKGWVDPILFYYSFFAFNCTKRKKKPTAYIVKLTSCFIKHIKYFSSRIRHITFIIFKIIKKNFFLCDSRNCAHASDIS